MTWSINNPASTDLYRANTHAHPTIVLRRKRCACGNVVSAKQLTQQGSCDTCARGKAGVQMPRAT
jgi:hypothetical protein